MKKRSKKYTEALSKIEKNKVYTKDEAVKLVKETSISSFDGSIEVAMRLNLDTKKADQQLRGAIVLPKGTGKTNKVLVVARGPKAQEAKDAGADYVGDVDILEKIEKENWFEFDTMIAAYLKKERGDDSLPETLTLTYEKVHDMRYGENPHQKGYFFGNFEEMFTQLHGKEISYNNLLDIDAAVNLIADFDETTFAILKHNNACGLASRPSVLDAWKDALAGDPVSAFGGVLITNAEVDKDTAEEMNKIFFEVCIAPSYTEDALEILKQKKRLL